MNGDVYDCVGVLAGELSERKENKTGSFTLSQLDSRLSPSTLIRSTGAHTQSTKNNTK